MEKLIIICEKKDKIANILCQKGFSYNYVCKLLRNKDIRIDDMKIKDNIEVEQGCKITVFYSAVELQKTMEIVYQDDNIIIVNKPASIEVEGHDGVAERLNAYAVHRLDRNTQGLLILAKTQEAKEILLQALKQHPLPYLSWLFVSIQCHKTNHCVYPFLHLQNDKSPHSARKYIPRLHL